MELDIAVGRALRSLPEVELTSYPASVPMELGLDPMGLNETDMFLKLKPKSEVARAGQGLVGRTGSAARSSGSLASTTASLSPSRCGCRRCSPAAVATWPSRCSVPTLECWAILRTRVAATVEDVRGARDVLTQTTEGVDYLKLDIDAAARWTLRAVGGPRRAG